MKKLFVLNNTCDNIHSFLDVRFTASCDNNCEFCIEKKGILQICKTNVHKMIESANNSGFKEILILGGEPFLLPRELLMFVSGIRHKFEKIYITTSLPNTFNTHSDICDDICTLIDGLNVSLQATDNDTNNVVLRARSKHNRIDVLKRLNTKHADKIRTSLNLVKGGIDTQEKLNKSLCDLQTFGCKSIKLNELQNEPTLYVSYEDITKTKLSSPFAHGCYTHVKTMGNMQVWLKRTCYIIEQSRTASLNDLVKLLYKKAFHKPNNKFGVLYEDGNILDCWRNKDDKTNYETM